MAWRTFPSWIFQISSFGIIQGKFLGHSPPDWYRKLRPWTHSSGITAFYRDERIAKSLGFNLTVKCLYMVCTLPMMTLSNITNTGVILPIELAAYLSWKCNRNMSTESAGTVLQYNQFRSNNYVERIKLAFHWVTASTRNSFWNWFVWLLTAYRCLSAWKR